MDTLTLSIYIEKILSLIAEHTNMKFLKELHYRGHSDATYLIIPSIAREVNKGSDETFLYYERELVETAKNRYPDVFRDEVSPLNLLARLQHYGIPTRLLDVTENPLVALYFACAENSDKDGEIIVFINNEASEISSSIDNAIADSHRYTYRISGGFTYLDIFLERVNSQPYCYDPRSSIAHLLRSGDAKKFFEIIRDKPLFVSAPQLSARQRIQQGKYILFQNEFSYIIEKPDLKKHFIKRSSDIPKELRDYAKGAFISKINEIPKTSEHIADIITVPRESKEELLQQLATFGITKSTLFPDNIDIGCSEIADSVRAWNRGKPYQKSTSTDEG